MLIWLAPGTEAKLKHAPEKSPVWFGSQKIHRFCVLKAFLVKKKGTKTVLSRVATLRSVAPRASDVCAENFSHSARLLLQLSRASFMIALCLRAVLISSPDTWDWMRMHALAVMHRRTLCENVDSAKIKVPFYTTDINILSMASMHRIVIHRIDIYIDPYGWIVTPLYIYIYIYIYIYRLVLSKD